LVIRMMIDLAGGQTGHRRASVNNYAGQLVQLNAIHRA
jgi:hypothetical protein